MQQKCRLPLGCRTFFAKKVTISARDARCGKSIPRGQTVVYGRTIYLKNTPIVLYVNLFRHHLWIRYLK